jgi:hypothetical protein
MKDLVLFSSNYVVYIAFTVLLSTSKLINPSIECKALKMEDVKQEVTFCKEHNSILHNALLYRF